MSLMSQNSNHIVAVIICSVQMSRLSLMSPPSTLLLLLSQIVPETQSGEREAISAVKCHQHVSGLAISLLLIKIAQKV